MSISYSLPSNPSTGGDVDDDRDDDFNGDVLFVVFVLTVLVCRLSVW